MIVPQLILDLHDEIIVDNFAGGGGASTGIWMALGRHVDHAINHDPLALGMHRINHPQTVHHCEDVFDVDPLALTQGRPVGLAHFSPDCKHFSKAKGGKPLDKKIRGLVLVMLRWAKIRPRVMTMENVEEIQTWGPLIKMEKNGETGWYPDPAHKGRTWRAFLDCLGNGIDPDHPDLNEILEVLGDTVTKAELVKGFGFYYQGKEIKGCDQGAPTIRNRFFLIARCDGRPIIWPAQSHADPKTFTTNSGHTLSAWRTIAECIDWSLPCPSIFLEGAAAKAARCKRPLVSATKRRIAKGLKRYVLDATEPFLVSLTHQGGDRVEAVTQPVRTLTGAHRGEKALVVPSLTKFHGNHDGRGDGGDRSYSINEPLLSQDTSNRFGLTEASLAPFLTEHANSSTQRNMPADEPMRTACGQVKGGHFAVVAGTLVHVSHGEQDKNGNPRRGRGARDVSEPMPTLTGSKDCGIATATVVQTGTIIGAGGPSYSGKPADINRPFKTQPTENHSALIGATLVGAGGRASQSRPRGVDEPIHTMTAKADTCVAAASMVKLRGTNVGDSVEAPMHTASAGGQHHAVLAASVVRQFGASVGQSADEPAPTTMSNGGGKTGLIAACLAQHNGGFNTVDARSAEEPLSAITGTGSQQQIIAASLAGYHKSEADGQAASEPARTATTKPRLAHVQSFCVVPPLTEEQIAGARRVAAFLREHGVEFEGEFATITTKDGAVWVIVDIGMRMLTPRELYRAQGFPEEYIIDHAWIWDAANTSYKEVKLTKEQQIRMVGNSVCPDVMAAIVRANVPELAISHPKASAKLSQRQRAKSKPRSFRLCPA